MGNNGRIVEAVTFYTQGDSMKLAVRAKATGRKVTLFMVAFMLTVGAFGVGVPFVLSQHANAIQQQGNSVTGITTAAEFQAALDDQSVSYIELTSNITITAPQKLVLSRSNVIINGNDSMVVLATPTASQSGWHSDYVFQVYNAQNVKINSLRLKGGDAGMLINGSSVTLTGNTHLNGHEYGGIEVSRGSAPGLSNSHLTLSGNVWTHSQAYESATVPTAWVVDGQGTITGQFANETLTAVSQASAGKTYYYVNPSFANVVATNVTQNKAYNSVATALAAAVAGDTVRLDKDVSLSQMLFISKAITFDGNGHTLTATFNVTQNGTDNAVVTINTDGVTVKNLTTTNTASGAKPHGVVVYNATGVTLVNDTFKNGRAGLVVNGSKVIADSIHTSGNLWYGVNVDKADAVLTLKGTSSYTEIAPVVNDDTTKASVVDADGQYVKYNITGATKAYYTLGALKQFTPVSGAVQNGESVTNSWTAAGGASSYIYQSYNDAAGTSLRWSQNTTSTSKTATNVADATFYWRVTAVDALGNKSDPTPLWKVTIDSTKPVAPTGLVWTTQDGTVLQNGQATNQANGVASWNASTSSDVDHYIYKYTNNIPGNQYAATPLEFRVNGTSQAGVFNQGEGTHYISVAAVDRAGNQSDWSPTFAIVFDQTPAEATITAATKSGVSGTAEAGARVVVTVDGVSQPAVTAAQDGKWEVSFASALTPGSHTLSVQVTDVAGNPLVSALTKTFTVVAEQQPAVSEPTTPQQPVALSQTGPFPAVYNGPVAINPSAQQVLGESTQPKSSTGEVEGAQTSRTTAQAVDANANKGIVAGLAWYWWLLIIAAVALVLWWIIAAIRRRSEQNA